MSAKCAQEIMIVTCKIVCVLNSKSLQGSHDSLLPSSSKHLEKITILTDQIIHTLKMSLYASVCNNTVAMRPLFIELIVSFCIKKHRENFCNTGKTQGISFWLECGHPVEGRHPLQRGRPPPPQEHWTRQAGSYIICPPPRNMGFDRK